MQMQQTHVHYAPASVGALMDPGFLRGAVLDAESENHHDEAVAHRSLRARCRAALQLAASVFRPRSELGAEEAEKAEKAGKSTD